MALVLAAPPSCRRHCKSFVVNARNFDEFQALGDGPIEPPMPRFDRGPPSIERLPKPPRDRSRIWRTQRRWRSYKATPKQAITGAVVGFCCSLASLRALVASYAHVSENPLAHDVPFGLTEDVNQAVLTMILGFGWLGVSLFALSSIGLALLAAKLVRTRTDDTSSWLQIFRKETFELSRDSPFRKMMALVGVVVVSIITGSEAYATQAATQVNARASDIFQRSCMGCHVAGGNILQPGATLKSEDLERNGLSTVQDIFNITYSGKARMPGFGEACTPRGQCTFGPRLNDEDIQTLAEFVKSQADRGWPAPP